MDPSPYEHFLIKHRQSGLYVDIDGANKAPKTKLLLWTKHGADNQTWYLDPTTWTYRSKLHDMCITFDLEKHYFVCDEVHNQDPNQQWQIAAMHFKNSLNQYFVMETVADAKAGTAIGAGNYTGQENQFWDFERIGSFAPAKMSDCPPIAQPGGPPPGVAICPMPPQFPGYPQPGAEVPGAGFNPNHGGATAPPLANPGITLPNIGANTERRYFLILTEVNGKAIDIKRGVKTAGTHIIMYKPNKDINQRWYCDDKGFIRSALNDMVFDANEAGHSLSMAPCIDDPRHQWKIEGNKIVNGKGQCLDIRGGGSSDGSELCAYQYKNAPNQHWKIQYL